MLCDEMAMYGYGVGNTVETNAAERHSGDRSVAFHGGTCIPVDQLLVAARAGEDQSTNNVLAVLRNDIGFR